MIFDKSKVYTALNAEELLRGDKVYASDTIRGLIEKVRRNETPTRIIRIENDAWEQRFRCDLYDYSLVYLVERAPAKSYVPWTNKTCPLECGDIITKCEKTGREYKYAILEIETMSIDDKNNGYCDLVYFGANALSYELLLSGGYTFNGKPCGEEVTPNAEV